MHLWDITLAPPSPPFKVVSLSSVASNIVKRGRGITNTESLTRMILHIELCCMIIHTFMLNTPAYLNLWKVANLQCRIFTVHVILHTEQQLTKGEIEMQGWFVFSDFQTHHFIVFLCLLYLNLNLNFQSISEFVFCRKDVCVLVAQKQKNHFQGG